jgi:CRP/FNR family transcriptional regulator, anaerobic regulatory protein
MAKAESDQLPSYFPSPRDELSERLRHGDIALDAAMPSAETIPAGRTLVRAGESHRTVYRLVTGKMARIRLVEDGRRQIICIFGPGDLMAVKAMLLDRQPDNIECLSPSTVKSVGYREALALAGEQPNVSLRFMWQLAEDERRLHNTVTMLGRGTAVERISTVLLDLQARIMGYGGQPTMISIRQQDLADHVGLTIVHVNRTLRSLRDQGTIETRTGRIILRDIAALHRHATPMLDVFERESPEFGAGV